MSLIDAYRETCVPVTVTRTEDGQGGYTTAFTDGEPFDASFAYENAPEVIVAEKQGVNRAYKMYVDKAMDLPYHAIIRRESDGQLFRVKNPGEGRHTPAFSALNLRLIEVEKWEAPWQEEEEA